MNKFKRLWEDEKQRKIIIAVLLIPVAFGVYSLTSSKKEYVSIEERIEQRNAEDRVDDKGRVTGLFDSEAIQDLDKDEFLDVYDGAVNGLRKREKNLYTEKEQFLEMYNQQQETIDELSLELKDLKRQNDVRAQARSGNGKVNERNQGSRRNQNSNDNNQLQRVNTTQQVDERVFDRTPAQFVTAKPQIEGRVIRTITQRSVRSIKNSGVIEEKMQKDLLITQHSQAPEKEITTGKGKDGGLVEADSGVVYLPSGSFFSGVLLTGLDAPTQLAAKSAPMPVVIRVKKEAILPNHFTLDIRECHVIGEAVGDLSSERAHIRAKTITCVRNDGKSVESSLQANAVSDFDGKLGIAGTLVSKNGNLLAGSMAAGFMSGISEAVAPTRSNSLNTSPGGQDLWQSVDISSVGAAGAFQGSANAMDRLAEYYIALAEQIHPVIEISPGRSVTFAVISGTRLKLGD